MADHHIPALFQPEFKAPRVIAEVLTSTTKVSMRWSHELYCKYLESTVVTCVRMIKIFPPRDEERHQGHIRMAGLILVYQKNLDDAVHRTLVSLGNAPLNSQPRHAIGMGMGMGAIEPHGPAYRNAKIPRNTVLCCRQELMNADTAAPLRGSDARTAGYL